MDKANVFSNLSFRAMSLIMSIEDALSTRVVTRSQTFGIKAGMTIVDYGCGPGRYSICVC